MAYNFNCHIKTSQIDCKTVVSQKWCKTATLLLQTTAKFKVT